MSGAAAGLLRASRRCQRRLLPPGPGLEVAFLPASADWQPDFTGMRMGGYRADDPVLRFQVAIPAQFAHSPLALGYVLAALEDVLGNAGDYFQDQRIAFDLAGWERVLSAARADEDPPDSAWDEFRWLESRRRGQAHAPRPGVSDDTPGPCDGMSENGERRRRAGL